MNKYKETDLKLEGRKLLRNSSYPSTYIDIINNYGLTDFDVRMSLPNGAIKKQYETLMNIQPFLDQKNQKSPAEIIKLMCDKQIRTNMKTEEEIIQYYYGATSETAKHRIRNLLKAKETFKIIEETVGQCVMNVKTNENGYISEQVNEALEFQALNDAEFAKTYNSYSFKELNVLVEALVDTMNEYKHVTTRIGTFGTNFDNLSKQTPNFFLTEALRKCGGARVFCQPKEMGKEL